MPAPTTEDEPTHRPEARARSRRLAGRLAAAWLALAAVAAATAATPSFHVALDVDADAATGCAIATPAGTLAGIDLVVSTHAVTSAGGATVGRLEHRRCVGGSFTAPTTHDAGGWNVGAGLGEGGASVIEASLPRSLLPRAGTMRAWAYAADDGGVVRDVTSAFAITLAPAPDDAVVPVPLSPALVPLLALALGAAAWAWGRRRPHSAGATFVVLVCACSGLAWAATALRDGAIGDWRDVAPAVTDPADDAPPDTDIVAVFEQQDAAQLYLRFDVRFAPANRPPSVGAGSAQTITLPAAAALAGSASDDGLPNPPGALTLAWSKLSGPGSVAFADAAAATTSATFDAAGSYVLRLTASDGALSASADVAITVQSGGGGGNRAPTVDAGPDRAVTLPAAAALAGAVDDDGLPAPPGALTIAWSLESGPLPGPSFGDPASPSTTATFTQPGTYVLRLTAGDGELASSDTVQVVVADGAPKLLAIPDRTIALGTRFQQVLQVIEGHAGDTLAYALPAAPAGASLAPAPLVDWMPTAAQLGTHAFTARVTDAGGRSDSASFNVTVVKDNRPPSLAPQPDATLTAGRAFARTLAASDPDGDALAFSLVAGPPGMTLAGANLGWPTPPTPGAYAVTVRVSDPDGAQDTRSFTITLLPDLPPVARDDVYEVRLGETLAVPAAGVLANDTAPFGRALAARKLDDPLAGSLAAFGADGAFTYEAPAVPPPRPFEVVRKWTTPLYSYAQNGFVAGDVDGDGAPDVVYRTQGGYFATRGRDGATIWNASPTNFFCQDLRQELLADIDDDGAPELVTMGCGPGGTYQLAVVDARDGTLLRQAALAPDFPDVFGGPRPVVSPVYRADVALARLDAGGPPRLLLWTNVGAFDGYHVRADGLSATTVGCRGLTGDPADQDASCKALLIIDPVTLAVERILKTSPLASRFEESGSAQNNEMQPNPAIVADLDGDGAVEIVAGGNVWSRAGGDWALAWGTAWTPLSTAVADLDGDGVPEVIHSYHWAPGGAIPESAPCGIAIHAADGTLRRRIALPGCYYMGLLTVADADGDGAPEILVSRRGQVHAIRPDGRMLWTHDVPSALETLPPLTDVIGRDARAVFPLSERTEVTTIVVYDLDGDGAPEVILNTKSGTVFLDGRDGKARAIHGPSGHSSVSPRPAQVAVLDLEGDGTVEVVTVSGCPYSLFQHEAYLCGGSFTALGPPGNDWLPGPARMPQAAWIDGAVDDAGRAVFDPHVGGNFRNPVQRGVVGDPRRIGGASFRYEADDGAGRDDAEVFLRLLPPNRPPRITMPLAYASAAFVPFGFTATAIDPDAGDTLAWSVTSASFTCSNAAPAIDAATGVFACANFQAYADTVVITLRVTDSQGAYDEQTVAIHRLGAPRTMPDVVGLAQGEAVDALATAGLNLGVVNALPSIAPAGRVLAQHPAAGAPVAVGAIADLTVSSGPMPVIVPFLVGEDLAAARLALQGLGLGLRVVPQASATVPRNTVMAQAPAAGTPVVPAPDAPVELVVSTGSVPAGTIARIVVEPASAARLVGDTIALSAIAEYADGTAADVTLNALWTTSAPAVAMVDATGLARGVGAGGATITATVGAHAGQAQLAIASQVADILPPVAAIVSPADETEITGPVPVVGTATDPHFHRYELAIAPAGESSWTLLAEGTTPVTNGELGRLDPATLVNDQYTLRLTVFDRGGNTSEATATVQVAGARKPGLFSLAFRDLEVALAGVPIAVTRTYDSRDKSARDFGVGWRLGLNTLRLRTNRVFGTGWVRSQSGINSSLAPLGPHKVSIALPDGRVEAFDLVLSPTAGVGSLVATRAVGLAPRSGTQGTLAFLGNTDLLVVNDGAEDVLLDDVTLDVWDPVLFRYTTLDGTRIDIHRVEGVRRIEDRNGNAVTFGPDGIRHSAGAHVEFTRDERGRITSIRDLNGHVQTYAYDGNGDLGAHTDATGATSRYAYDRKHNLIEIRNALGVRATRNEYDATGRLVSMTDADGNTIAFARDEAANEETITDRRGHVTRLAYDDRGNVTRQERVVTIEGVPVLAVTTSTFDALGNETSTTDPDGRRVATTFAGILPTMHVVDPGGLGLASTFSYDARNEVTLATDPGGRTYAFAYDAAGRMTAAEFPHQGATSIASDARGEPIEGVDATGVRTVLVRDALGRVTREETFDSGGALLRRVESTYDGNGNRTGHTLYRTIDGTLTPITTRYAYDAANRLVEVIDPDGGIVRMEYDANGLAKAEVDPLGRRTSHVLDPLGRRIRTDFPDGTHEAWTFDPEGNATAHRDRGGRVRTHEYDEANRRVRTTHPDATVTRTIFTAGGRIAASIDAQGRRTEYAYDGAGRLTETTLPPVVDGPGGATVRPRLRTAYTALGAPAEREDPLGRVTTYTYDGRGRLVLTSFADGTTTQASYDAKGRRIGTVNEEGEATTLDWDGLDRLTATSGLAGQGAYGYDEAGNVISLTDALGRVTHLGYDRLNRLVERRYPGGETERFAWDAAGHLAAYTDGSGRVTTFERDAMNRVTVKRSPGGATTTFAYGADGQRSSVTDARGTTVYTYDSMGRLGGVRHPDGTELAYAYDADGNLARLTSPSGTVAYGYDALNRLERIDAPEGTHRSAYDLAGNRVQRIASNGVVSSAAFDLRDRPTSLVHRDGGGATLMSFAVGYSPSGRRSSLTESDGSTETYAYDARGRLVSETRTGVGPYAITHVYDPVGNRTQIVRDGVPTTFTYDMNDRLVAAGATTYTWDANGALASRTEAGVATNYGFDAERRLVSVARGGAVEQLRYDHDGHLVARTSGVSTTRFLVDDRNPTGLAQVLEEHDGSAGPVTRYTLGDERTAMVRGGNASFYLGDPSRSVRALAGTGGSITDRYRYDAYGRLVESTGATANPYRYRAERFDEDSGLYHLRARYYAPDDGRFVSRDPFEGRLQRPVSLHRYLYADADPVNHIDPLGTESLVSLSVSQSISNTIKASEAASTTNQACNAFSTLGAVGLTVMAGQLAYGFASAWFEGFGSFKNSFSVFAVNPAVLKGTDIKSTDFRFEPGPKVSLNFAMKDGKSQSGSIGPDGFNVSYSGPIKVGKNELKKELKKCETITVGSVQLKATTTNWMGINLPTFIPAVAIEVEFLKVIRNQWKLFDGIAVDLRSPTGF